LKLNAIRSAQRRMRRVAVLGAGAGGAAAVAELVAAGHEVRFWGRSPKTLAPFRAQGGIAHEGALGSGIARPNLITGDLREAAAGTDALVVCVPSFAHADIAAALAAAGVKTVPIVLNPGHTGGALEFRQASQARGADPPIAEFSTLTYVCRKYRRECVTITGLAKSVRLAALPGGDAALAAGQDLFACAKMMPDVIACDLANVNMVLHVPGAVLAAAWIEATRGDFTFYVAAMTAGVVRVMRALDDERRSVARAFGHELPSLIAEMQAIGTVPASAEGEDFAAAIAAGEANRQIKAPDSLGHRYYREDFGFGLLPFTLLASIAGVAVPTATSLLRIGETLVGADLTTHGRTAARMGIAGLDRAGLLKLVGAKQHGQ
jgi:opine dehydrogenase